jgi:hypothetical protein
MSMARVVIMAVVLEGRSKSEVARDSGHGNLPVGGQRISLLADTKSPHGRSPVLPG